MTWTRDRITDTVVSAVLLAVIAVTTFALPDQPPLSALLTGAARGCRYALLAAAVFLVYRSSRVVHFAVLALGIVGGELFVDLAGIGIDGIGTVPFWIAMLAALVAAVAVGAVFELLLVRRFFTSPRVVLTVVTIVATPAVGGLAEKVSALPFWRQDAGTRAIRRDLHLMELPWEGPVAGAYVAIAITAVTLAALAGFLRYTSTGTALRGTAENPDRALLLGINVRLLSTLVWTIAAVLGTLAVLLQVFEARTLPKGSQLAAGFGTTMLPPLVAVAVARMRSLWLTCLAAVALSVMRSGIEWSFPGSRAAEYVTLAVLLGALLLQRGGYSRDDRALAATWEGAREVRPTPREMLALPSVRLTRRAAIGTGAVLLAVFPHVMSTDQSRVASIVAMNVVLALSVVVMTGWGGQISLGQIAFLGIGAFTAGWLGEHAGLPFWLVVPVVVVLTGLLAIPLGSVALKVRGPYLPVLTLAFAWAWYVLAFGSPVLDEYRAGNLRRPRLVTLSLASDRAYYYVCVAAAIGCVLLVRRLRAGRLGRLLIAVRDDEYGVQPFGVSAARTRTAVFALSGGLAGLAGVLLVYQMGVVPDAAGNDVVGFGLSDAVDGLVMVVVGGLSSISGAVLGAVYVGVTRLVFADIELRRLTTSTGLLMLLYVAPGGLSQVAYGARDAVLRLIALRRRMLVPSLFTDRDPADVLAQRTPITPRERDAARRRYALPSGVHPTTTESLKPAAEVIPS